MQSSPSPNTGFFYDKKGYHFPGVSEQQLIDARRVLTGEFGVSNLQIAEAASYSLAMVVRFALGLSASGGKVCVVFNDSLAGEVALACARHLCNAGGNVVLLPFCTLSNASDELKHQLYTLGKMDISPSTPETLDLIQGYMNHSHNLIFALYGGSVNSTFGMDEFVKLLNESQLPIHCIEAPYGVNSDTGAAEDEPLFASSTLSLGAPLKGLYTGSDYVGRHYVCDISLTSTIYRSMGEDLTPLFSDQPVVQVFPEKEDETC